MEMLLTQLGWLVKLPTTKQWHSSLFGYFGGPARRLVEQEQQLWGLYSVQRGGEVVSQTGFKDSCEAKPEGLFGLFSKYALVSESHTMDNPLP